MMKKMGKNKNLENMMTSGQMGDKVAIIRGCNQEVDGRYPEQPAADKPTEAATPEQPAADKPTEAATPEQPAADTCGGGTNRTCCNF